MARCAPEAMRDQGAFSEFLRKTSLTTWHPIMDRKPGCGEDIRERRFSVECD